MSSTTLEEKYNYDVVRLFTLATLFWGIVGFAAGIFIALQMVFPSLNIEPYLSFGRLRPVHTSAVIFAFGGNALFATSYFVVQRTCGVRLWGIISGAGNSTCRCSPSGGIKHLSSLRHLDTCSA